MGKMIQHLRQTRKNNCGQACLAMVTGKTVEEIEEGMRWTGRTSTRMLIQHLARLGLRTSNRLRLGVPRVGFQRSISICKASYFNKRGRIKKNWHWIVLMIHGGNLTLLDPNHPCAEPLQSWSLDNFNYRITSHLPIVESSEEVRK